MVFQRTRPKNNNSNDIFLSNSSLTKIGYTKLYVIILEIN